eukprot:8167683-Alexandrium_andersonii.AAC.1
MLNLHELFTLACQDLLAEPSKTLKRGRMGETGPSCGRGCCEVFRTPTLKVLGVFVRAVV